MNKQTIFISTLILLVIAGLAGGLFYYSNSQNQSNSPQVAARVDFTPLASSSATPQPTEEIQAALAQSEYADGTYQTTGSYTSPGGRESVQVSLTIQDDTVIDATVNSLAKHDTSKQYQALFVEGYKPLVVGKKISEINVSHVSGSSLTSAGFNQALAAIKTRAQSTP